MGAICRYWTVAEKAIDFVRSTGEIPKGRRMIYPPLPQRHAPTPIVDAAPYPDGENHIACPGLFLELQMNHRKWMRDLHLYAGLFISPFLLIFAISTILINHTWRPSDAEATDPKQTVQLATAMPKGLDMLEKAHWVRGAVGIQGEVSNLFHDGNTIDTQIFRPGERFAVRVDLEAGTATVTRSTTTFWDRLATLHTTPGPHLAGFRGNWIFTKIWRGLVDASVALLLFSTASGIYLWLLIRSQRKTGLVVLGSGALSFVLLVAALTA